MEYKPNEKNIQKRIDFHRKQAFAVSCEKTAEWHLKQLVKLRRELGHAH